MNIADIEGFYTSPIGMATQALLMARLGPAIAAAPDQMVLGLGFATPYLPIRPSGTGDLLSGLIAVASWTSTPETVIAISFHPARPS